MTHRTPPVTILVVLFAALAAVPVVHASDDLSTPGSLVATGADGKRVEMPLEHTSVSIDVSAFVARAVIEQTFSNPFEKPVEAVYTFPLGGRAAVDDFELVVGDRTIRGEIRRREDARATYEQARAAGYQAALLEQERPNVFTQSVANLEPGKKVVVRIRTVEPLGYEKGIYHLLFPLVVGPRHVPVGMPATAAAKLNPPILEPGIRSGHDVDISVRLDAGVPIRAISSPSHRIRTEQPTPASARVWLAADETIPNKDFILRWIVSAERPAVGLLAHREGLDGFFTLLVQPKGEVTALEAAPKEIVVVVDTSGSMSGVPIEAAKRFVTDALREMGPRDTFNLIRFSGDNEVLWPKPLVNSHADVKKAIAWIGRQRGGGGTEMLPALLAAFALPPDPARVRVVVFVTDGYVGNEDQILGAIGKVVGDARIYTVGIGSSVNHFLLDRMADLGRGAYTFIRPDANAGAAVERFRAWVTKPYLTDLTVDWGALSIADVSPERLRDLGSGQTLAVVGRYLEPGQGEVVVRGRLAGAHWEQRIQVQLPEREERHEALGELWARGRIEELLLSSPGDATESVRAGVTSLALEYRLMSPFTSFVAVDDSRVVNPSGEATTVQQAVPLPEGVSFAGIFGPAGPGALAIAGEVWPEDRDPEVHAPRGADVERVSVGGGVVGGGVLGGVLTATIARNAVQADSITEKVQVVPQDTSARGPRVGDFKVMVGGSSPSVPPATTDFSDAFIKDPPIAASFYRNLLKLEQGTSGDHAVRAPEGTRPEARDRLLDAALRVLADLADDGKLSASEGRPALASLLGAQRRTGAVSVDVVAQSIASWALAEAAVRLPSDPWVAEASRKATDYLTQLGRPEGWPSRPGAEVAEAATSWARLVLARLRPEVVANAGRGDLRGALLQLRSYAPGSTAGHRSAIERLLGSLERRNLRLL